MTDLATLQNLDYWQRLCPDLTISPTTPLDQINCETPALRSDDWNVCKELIHEDGYFAYDSWFDPKLIDSLADCLLKLETENMMPGFCFVYDEFWHLLRGLNPLFSDLLDQDYLMLPAVWAWLVRDTKQTGFSPHRDQVRDVGVDDEEHLDYLTIWIPLTDLNHLSSCISLLPASADPEYDEGTDRVTVENLQDIRTLQGKRGSVFCWATGLIHWGSKQSRFGPPRMSVGYYVQRTEAEILDPPPLDFSKPLSLPDRLSIIGQQIFTYSRDDDPKVLALANELVRLTGNEPRL